MKTYETLKLEEKENGILIVGLNRPDKLNAMNRQMVNELCDLWTGLAHNLDIRVVILRSEAEKGFCGGMDVADCFQPNIMNGPGMYDFQLDLGRIELAMRQMPQPIICAVHGAAAGAGMCFALASDIRIITPDARFNAAFINVGIGGADMGSSYFLTRLIPAGRAYELMYTGRFIKADEAMQLGLASYCVERDQLMDKAMEIAQVIASKEPFVIKLTKEAINLNLDCPGLEAAIQLENRNQNMIILNTLNKSK
ncbi:enoyl-CoA hydratase/isomerase family protein [Syntrophomonas palmitatica]|uniref:enoyl-CoA hydratase/isomerase family protein n=1 Tax=Syntrophomonas palmitatica TaxID=402877 RepID=UPI0006D0017D|nr:enoyl-CoA hydratase/isomerase family protein [Syntrophomonas palmitatica]